MDMYQSFLLACLIVLLALPGCRKKHEIVQLQAEIITLSARQGHIFNVFALDRIHTHSYNAVEETSSDPWSFTINDVDILGENGQLIIDPHAKSAIIISGSTANTVTFINAGTNQNKTALFSPGAKLSIDFSTAREAAQLMGLSREQQRDTLRLLAMEAEKESFSVATH